MPKRRPKNTLDILGRKFAVEKIKTTELSGAMYPFDAKIVIQAGQDEYATRDTLLHEVMHAILYQQGRGTGGGDEAQYLEEESYVKPLATGLIAFFRANPQVANWLIADPELY